MLQYKAGLTLWPLLRSSTRVVGPEFRVLGDAWLPDPRVIGKQSISEPPVPPAINPKIISKIVERGIFHVQ